MQLCLPFPRSPSIPDKNRIDAVNAGGEEGEGNSIQWLVKVACQIRSDGSIGQTY